MGPKRPAACGWLLLAPFLLGACAELDLSREGRANEHTPNDPDAPPLPSPDELDLAEQGCLGACATRTLCEADPPDYGGCVEDCVDEYLQAMPTCRQPEVEFRWCICELDCAGYEAFTSSPASRPFPCKGPWEATKGCEDQAGPE